MTRKLLSRYIKDNYAFLLGFSTTDSIADSDIGLNVVDIANPEKPELVATLPTAGIDRGLAIRGNYAYFAEAENILTIDISDPKKPVVVDTMAVGHFNRFGSEGGTKIRIFGDYAYVMLVVEGALILDVSNGIPKLVSQIIVPQELEE